jgi:hypothetical protein
VDSSQLTAFLHGRRSIMLDWEVTPGVTSLNFSELMADIIASHSP